MATNPVRVLIADDHTLVREGVLLLLSVYPEFEVTAEAADGEQAVRLALEQDPDIVLLDIRMPVMDGMEALEQIRRLRPEIKVLILTMYEDEALFFKALKMGACGYLLKGTTSSELVAALRTVARGEIYLPSRMATVLVQDYVRGWRPLLVEEPEPAGQLSARELEVLRLLAAGLTNVEIAARLVISASTVQTHRARIMEKLGLKTRSDLVKYALRHGLLLPEP